MCAFIIFGILAYLLGAVPTAYLVGRLNGVDIRTVGSGNVGATNVLRSIGKGWGIFTFIADAAKGLVPAWLFASLAIHLSGNEGNRQYLGLAFAALAVAGHNWPVYLGFKGGKGVATSAGALLGLSPVIFGIGIAVWVPVFLLSRYVSLASITAALAVGGASWFVFRDDPRYVLPVVFSLLCALLILRHRGNVKRLLAGTENKIGRSSRTPSA